MQSDLLNNNNQKENRFILCLHAVDKYENIENVNTHNDYETMSKKLTDKKKTDLFFVSCKCV